MWKMIKFDQNLHNMNIKLILRNVNKKTSIGTVNVYLDFNTNGFRQQKFFKTPVKVEKHLWSAPTEKVVRYHPNHRELNELLDSEKRKVIEEINELRRSEIEVTPYALDMLKEKKNEVKKDLCTLAQEYIESRLDLTARHKQKLESLIARLNDFSGLKKIHYSQIDQKWIDSFGNYLQRGNPTSKFKRFRKGQQPSTINKTFSFLKQIFNHLHREGIIDDRFKHFKYPKGFKTKKVVLTESEIKKIMDYQPLSNKLRKIKDLSLIQIMTGLRYSDVIKIRKSSINGGGIEIMNTKTKKITKLPLYDSLQLMLEKHNYDLSPLKVSNQKYNDYIRELFELAEINAEVEFHYFENGRIKTELKPKFQLVTSHTFRRTFITQAIIMGIPIHVIQTMTGHTTLRQLSEYVNIAEEIAAIEIKKINTIFNHD